MIDEPTRPVGPNNGHSKREREVEEAVARYLDRLTSGETVDPDEVLLENPDLGTEILAELKTFVKLGAREQTLVGAGVLGDYRLIRQVGRGGMGVVYEAWQGSMERRVALKVLPAGIAADTRAVTRFVREARVAGKLHHPHVVSVFGMGVEQNTPFYAMEFVDGETLAQILEREKSLSVDARTTFGFARNDIAFYSTVARAFADVTEGLQHAHTAGVIHRDLKPSNLILERAAADGIGGAAPGKLRILDFGLARSEGDASLTRSGDFMGTVLYMSPEQAMAKRIPIDHRTDVYSMGVTLYEVLAQRPPFEGRSTQETLSHIIVREPPSPSRPGIHVPPDLETIVLKCLRKDPAERYSTAEALSQDLRRYSQGLPIEARPQAQWEKWARRAWRFRARLATAAALLALLAASGGLTMRLAQRTSEDATRAYEKAVVSASMKLLRAERVLATKRSRSSEIDAILSLKYKNLLTGSGRLVAEEAVGELSRAIADLPERFEAYHYRAKGLKLLQNAAGAIQDIGECLRRNPSFLPARALLADLEEDGVQKGKPLPPPAPDANDRWGGAWLRAHEAMKRSAWKDAVAAYNSLLALEEESKGELFLGSSIENFIGRGVALMESKDFEGGKRDFWEARTTSRKLWGEFVEPLLLLGKAYVLEGKPSRAEESFREALDRSIDKEKMSLWIAAGYESLLSDLEASGRFEDAVAAARKAVEFHAEDRDARLRLGWVLLRADWWKKERKATGAPDAGPDGLHEIESLAAQVIARNPNEPFAYALWSKALEAQGKLVLASELAEKAEALLGGGDLSRRQDMKTRTLASTAAMAAVLTLGIGVEGRAQHELEGTFTDVEQLGADVNSPFSDQRGLLSGDRRTLVFTSERPAVTPDANIYIAERQDTDHPFTEVRNLTELNTGSGAYATFLSDDALRLYYFLCPGFQCDLYCATRAARDEPFENPQPLDELNTPDFEGGLSVTEDGLEFFFISDRPGGSGGRDIWGAKRAADDKPFTKIWNLEELNTRNGEAGVSISANGLTLFWSDFPSTTTPRPGGVGAADIWCAFRASRDEDFGPAVNLGGPINSSGNESWLHLSPHWPADRSPVYFSRCRDAGCDDIDIYQATWRITPLAPRFRRGDADSNSALELTDPVALLNFLFTGGAAPACLDAADFDDDGEADISDAIANLGHQFLGGPPPAAPGAITCGADPNAETPDLTCSKGC